MAQYRLNFVEGRLDGSGLVAHDLTGLDNEGNVVPGRHSTLNIPEDRVNIVMAMPDGTGPQKQAKNTAYKDLLVEFAPDGWEEGELDDIVEKNAEAVASADGVDDYINDTLGQAYPVQFSL